jgi:hypothetical protein
VETSLEASSTPNVNFSLPRAAFAMVCYYVTINASGKLSHVVNRHSQHAIR